MVLHLALGGLMMGVVAEVKEHQVKLNCNVMVVRETAMGGGTRHITDHSKMMVWVDLQVAGQHSIINMRLHVMECMGQHGNSKMEQHGNINTNPSPMVQHNKILVGVDIKLP